MIKKGWGEPQGLSIVDLSPNTFLFNFTNPETPSRILEEAPSNILGHVLVLQQWNRQISTHEVDYTYMPYWVQIHGMPLEYFSTQNAARAGSKIGKVLEIEDPFHGTAIKRAFLRVRVAINTEEPLVVGFWLPRNPLPRIWIHTRYEKLKDLCYNCGRLGHDQKTCKYRKVMDVVDPIKPMYGPWMGVAPVKNITPGNPTEMLTGDRKEAEENSPRTVNKGQNGKEGETQHPTDASLDEFSKAENSKNTSASKIVTKSNTTLLNNSNGFNSVNTEAQSSQGT